jgi:ADP-ribose pyrophosphatase YjhB (NUDIX family)
VNPPSDPRAYPDRPFVAVSAAIFRNRQVMLVRRARPAINPVFTLPGGVVEVGETLVEAVHREVMEETAVTIETAGLAGHREFILRDPDQRVARHFIILAFAARWVAGEPMLNEELSEYRWTDPASVAGLPTTEGLAEVVEAAAAHIGLSSDA